MPKWRVPTTTRRSSPETRRSGPKSPPDSDGSDGNASERQWWWSRSAAAGISSGIVLGLRAAGFREVPIVGAEPLLANDAAESLRRGELTSHAGEALSLADGARLPRLGAKNWAILRNGLSGIVEVPEAAIAEGVRRLFAEANLKAEPTGALGIGALLCESDRFAGREVIAVITGGNVDPSVYARILRGADSLPEATS